MKLLFLGDVVGEPGRTAIFQELNRLQEEHEIDFTVINGENSAGGKGITAKITKQLLEAGADVITTGDHVWDQREIVEYFPTQPRLLRPINYGPDTVGQGSVILETQGGKVGVINAQGRTFMNPPLDNPFTVVEEEVRRMREEGVLMIFVDFHAETTSESIAMGHALDGSVSAVIGTHTHVQTADEKILPQGTAHLTDAGMCGPDLSILGREVASVVWRFRTGMPTRFPVAKGPVRLCGAVIEIDPLTGLASSILRVNELLE